ncbi:MAG: hypothetical protein RLY93_11460 [Sumerlaeia bacterium]
MTSFLKAGEAWGPDGFVPETLVLAEAWGEIWRGQLKEADPAFLVVYATEAGRRLYAEAAPHLERWKVLAETFSAPGLLNIRAMHGDAEVPHLLVEDPGGPIVKSLAEEAMNLKAKAAGLKAQANTLKGAEAKGLKGQAGELEAQAAKTFSLKKEARMAQSAAKASYDALSHGLGPVNLTPLTIVEDPSKVGPADAENRWRLIPVAPGVSREAALLGGGRYTAPELAAAKAPDEVHADVYAISWIWAECAAGNFELPRKTQALRNAVPFKRLVTILEGGITPRNGQYPDPKMTRLAADRYAKKEADEDATEVLAARAAEGRSPAQQKLYENRGLLIKGGIALASVILLIVVILNVKKLVIPTNTTGTPYGVVNLYFDALIDGDADEAKTYASGGGVMHTDMLLADIRRMENEELASKFTTAVPQVSGSHAEVRQANVDLKGENGDMFMEAVLTLRKQGEEWVIEQVLFEPTRTKE